MKAKEKIIITAVNLFNQHGVNKISTNIISEVANISPGNLYYHYKNKEEIIRNIFINIKNSYDNIWKTNILSIDFIDSIEKYFQSIYDIQMKYHFFYLELFSLILKDPILKKMYQDFFETEKIKLSLLIQKGISEEVIKEISDQEINQFVESLLNNFQYWALLGNLTSSNNKYNNFSGLREWLNLIVYPYLKKTSNEGETS